MVAPTLEQELHQQLDDLLPAQQQQVLDFARSLASNRLRGTPGENLLRFAGTISPEDLAAMTEAIKDCERIDEGHNGQMGNNQG